MTKEEKNELFNTRPCDSGKYEKNNLTYHSCMTPCGVIEQNCIRPGTVWNTDMSQLSQISGRKEKKNRDNS